LWSRDLIEECRVEKPPALRRVAIAIDPAVSVSEASDETGIIVAGLGTDGHGYVLEDASGRYQPVDWARKAISLYRVHGADRIIAESNQGGAMVATTLATVDSNAPVKLVNASRGKITRAEPISSLFEQKRAHFCGTFPELEDQFCTYTSGSIGSPDRLDAMVWAFTELTLQMNNFDGYIEWAKTLALEGTVAPPAVDPLSWRGGLKALPPPAGNEITRAYFAAREALEVERPAACCARCGGSLRQGARRISDHVDVWHLPEDCAVKVS
jgi:predicted phage terminase large subunit-like protein